MPPMAPAPVTPITPPPIVQPTMPPQKKSKLWLTIVIILLGILVIAGGLFAYTVYSQTPDKVMAAMYQKQMELKTVTTDLTAYINIVKPTMGENNVALSFLTGSEENVDLILTGHLETELTNREANRANLAFTLATKAAPSDQVGVALKVTDDATFIELNKLPATIVPVASNFMNSWVKLDMAEAARKLGKPELATEIEQKSQEEAQIVSQIKTLLANNQPYTLNAVLPDDIINEQSMFHYSLMIDKAKVKTLLTSILPLLSDTAENNEQILAEANDILNNLSINNLEIWVGKKDKYLHRVAFNLNLPNETETFGGTAAVIMNYSNFNAPIAVTDPEKFITLDELLESVLTSFMGGETTVDETTTSTTEDLTIDSDLDGLTDNEEDFWWTDPNNPDTDGDGYSDFEEVENGYSPIGPGKIL